MHNIWLFPLNQLSLKERRSNGMNIKQSLKYFGIVGLMACNADVSFGAPRVYDGGGTDNNWSTAANWNGDTSLVAGDSVTFGISGDLTINNDLSAGFSVGGINFSTGVPTTTLTGNSINLSTSLQNNSGNLQIINFGINLVSPTFVPLGDTISIDGAVNGTGGFALIGGSLNLNNANSYSGGTLLQSDLQLGANDALGTGGLDFAGGVLSANNRSDNTIGLLSLSGDSTLHLSPGGAVGILSFDSAEYIDGTILITGWSGVEGSAGSDDKIIITGSIAGDLLSNIQFQGFGLGAIQLPDGEIVPVPEPTEWAMIIFAALAGLYKFGIHRFRKTAVA